MIRGRVNKGPAGLPGGFSDVRLEPLRQFSSLLDPGRHLRMCFWWIRRVTRVLEHIWGRFLGCVSSASGTRRRSPRPPPGAAPAIQNPVQVFSMIRNLLIRNLEARWEISWPGNADPQSRKLLNGAADNSLATGAFGALGGSRDYIGAGAPPPEPPPLLVLFFWALRN